LPGVLAVAEHAAPDLARGRLRELVDGCWGAEDHLAERLAFRDSSGSALSQPLMRTRFDEVTDVLDQDAPQVLIAENE
jgi:hypothetical protein